MDGNSNNIPDMGAILRDSGRTLRDAFENTGGDAREQGLGVFSVDDGVRSLRLLLRLDATAAEDIPELTGLLMQVGEHLAQALRIGCHLSWQLHPASRGSLTWCFCQPLAN